ncbi:unnamed protein product [Lathyrus oleraceus]
MIIGLTTKALKATNATLDQTTITEASEILSSSAKAISITKSIHDRTSLMIAAERATLPNSELISFHSARILARTGNALTERTTPRINTKELPFVAFSLSFIRKIENSALVPNGNTRPETAMVGEF